MGEGGREWVGGRQGMGLGGGGKGGYWQPSFQAKVEKESIDGLQIIKSNFILGIGPSAVYHTAKTVFRKFETNIPRKNCAASVLVPTFMLL